MDCTQINFSLQTAAVSLQNDMVITVPAQKFDLSASIFLTSDKALCAVGGLFFSVQSSLETALFRVREGFENLVISVKYGIRKFFGKVRSMWRGRVKLNYFCKMLKVPAFTVMRT